MATIDVTKETFQEEVLLSELPVLVEFWATWCGPCKALAPIMDEISEEYKGKVKVCKVNIDDQAELAAEYSVMAVPSIMVVKEGEITSAAVGYRAKEELTGMLDL